MYCPETDVPLLALPAKLEKLYVADIKHLMFQLLASSVLVMLTFHVRFDVIHSFSASKHRIHIQHLFWYGKIYWYSMQKIQL